MSNESTIWLDEQHPFEAAQSELQIASIMRLLGESPKRILDLGCGIGRILLPLDQCGHAVTGIDCVNDALATCRANTVARDTKADLIHGDFCNPLTWNRLTEGAWDAVICLGNTWMTLVEVRTAVEVMRRIERVLKPEGLFLLDNFTHDFWPELTAGNWGTGISPDGSMQMIWADDDAVFTIRKGKRVEPECEVLRPDDRLFRLWTQGALTLAAYGAGLSAPVCDEAGCVLVMHPERPSEDG